MQLEGLRRQVNALGTRWPTQKQKQQDDSSVVLKELIRMLEDHSDQVLGISGGDSFFKITSSETLPNDLVQSMTAYAAGKGFKLTFLWKSIGE